ncbi:MAG: hypothetical protein EPN60_06895 [Nevskiaceae bacterium]|jgi:hypothetical protein|nr:MAG: hypothetical protein EPO48_15080 [Nevskiaceae bacterium]TAM28725.1 MAG: hypothetical protein EPN60_06895 [Nevskiaceae bacterium]
MLSLSLLWLPILLAAVAVFFTSSLVHMVFKWHNPDYRKLANEDEVREAIRKGNPAPGQYVLPHCLDGKDMQKPEVQQKFIDGPVGLLVLRPSGAPKIGAHLLKWMGLALLVSALSAAIACTGLGRGADPHRVFHVIALCTLLAYGAGAVSDGIWKGHPWAAVAKDLLDALLYAAVSGAVFAWLWPH